MAQINVRLPDEVSEKAGETLALAGFTLNSYFQGLAQHIAETGQIPVIIRQKSVALKPEEVFLEAFIRFRTAYTHVHDIYEEGISNAAPGGTERISLCGKEVRNALDFFKEYEKVITAAPSQLEAMPGVGSEEVMMYARSPELFHPLTRYLNESLNCAGSQADMEQALLRAAGILNELQKIVSGEVSAGTSALFLIQDARAVIDCAEVATRKGQTYMVARAWTGRMKEAFERADLAFLSLTADAHIGAFSRVITLLRRLVEDVDRYVLSHPNPPGKFTFVHKEELSRLLDNLGQHYSSPGEL